MERKQGKQGWVALTALLVLGLSSSCLRAQRAHRNRALAEKSEAEAELARAQTEAIQDDEGVEFVAGEHAPEPPAAREDAPARRPSARHVWIAGSHVWRAGRWFWVRGYWALPPRQGVAWVPGHWAPRPRGFVWVPGAWR